MQICFFNLISLRVFFNNCIMNLSAGPHMHLICLPADGTLDFMVIRKEGESLRAKRDSVLFIIFHIFGI